MTRMTPFLRFIGEIIMAKHEKIIVGNCGEYYVAAFLSGMGVKVAVERVNAPSKDLLVSFGEQSITVQVKCGKAGNHEIRIKNPEESYWVWRVGKKCMDQSDKDHWYAFVCIGESGHTWPKSESPPKIFFVPSKVVAKTLRDAEQSQNEWFWMYEDVAASYCGLTGFQKLKNAITR